tara:strand:+ start:1317 stop:1505 length:189 start_codon:yes stop_codon:yes gene_type:complete
MSIIKSKAFRALIKPIGADSFHWYISGILDAKQHSQSDSEALNKYQRLGYKIRAKLEQQKVY